VLCSILFCSEINPLFDEYPKPASVYVYIYGFIRPTSRSLTRTCCILIFVSHDHTHTVQTLVQCPGDIRLPFWARLMSHAPPLPDASLDTVVPIHTHQVRWKARCTPTLFHWTYRTRLRGLPRVCTPSLRSTSTPISLPQFSASHSARKA
jgi:hypothetical protein